jgi:hypothetical protein
VRILYSSVHQVLEYDELRLLRDLGHDVFSLGAFFRGGAGDTFRPPLDLGPVNAMLLEQFSTLGCHMLPGDIHLSAEWVSLFDVCIVMHDTQLLASHWDVLSIRPVFLRLIGQSIEATNVAALPWRNLGLRVIRYSPNEMLADSYVFGDTTIRFGKYAMDYGPWTGGDPRVLTFANNFRSRYPEDFARWCEVTEDLGPALGGVGNEGCPGDLGLVSSEQQQTLLCQCAAYLYCTGENVPYTLNFIEAWMSGIPLVVLDAGARRHRFFEIAHLIRHGVDGFVCSDPETTREAIATLQADPALGERIGQAGRASAIALFGDSVIKAEWQALLAGATCGTA